MRWYRRVLFVAVVLPLAGCHPCGDPAYNGPGWELSPPTADATPVTAREKLPGLYPAGSRVKDTLALGGFSPCDNHPKDLAGKPWGANGAVSLIAFPDEPVAYLTKHRGLALRVVNRTGQAVPFAACDSMLMLVREAKDAGGSGGRSRRRRSRSAGTASTECFWGRSSTGSSRHASTPAG